MTIKQALEKKALIIAIQAHVYQIDKGGKPYIEHPLRIAQKCQDIYRQTVEQAVKQVNDIEIKEHTYQIDKGGKPYIEHPIRLGQKCQNGHRQTVIALLHDVIEDSEYEFSDLLDEGFSQDIIESLKLLTRPRDMRYEIYIDRLLKSNDIDAIMVKKYDLEDNMDITRLNEIHKKDVSRLVKYHTQHKRIVEYLNRLEGILK